MTTSRPSVPFRTRLYYRIVQSGRYVDKEYHGNILAKLTVALLISAFILLPFSLWYGYEKLGENLALTVAVGFTSLFATFSAIFLAALSVGALYRRRIKRDADLLHWALPYTYLNSHPEIDRGTYLKEWLRVPLPLERKALLMQARIPLEQAVRNSTGDDDLTLIAAIAGDYQEIPHFIEYEEDGW